MLHLPVSWGASAGIWENLAALGVRHTENSTISEMAFSYRFGALGRRPTARSRMCFGTEVRFTSASLHGQRSAAADAPAPSLGNRELQAVCHTAELSESPIPAAGSITAAS